MRKVDSCPVTHISLHVLLKELVTLGAIGTQDVYRPGFGVGTKYTYNGLPLQFKIGFTGKVDWLETNTEQPLVFNEPYDLAYSGKTLVTYAKSL